MDTSRAKVQSGRSGGSHQGGMEAALGREDLESEVRKVKQSM